jgi:hypothetical protein
MGLPDVFYRGRVHSGFGFKKLRIALIFRFG